MAKPNLSSLFRILLGVAFSTLVGVAFVLAFPPYEIWPLVFVGLVPVLVAQYRILPPKLSSYRWFILSGITNWADFEMIRLFISIAYPLYRQIWLIQPASIFGIIGAGMMVMLVNYLLAHIAWLALAGMIFFGVTGKRLERKAG